MQRLEIAGVIYRVPERRIFHVVRAGEQKWRGTLMFLENAVATGGPEPYKGLWKSVPAEVGAHPGDLSPVPADDVWA